MDLTGLGWPFFSGTVLLVAPVTTGASSSSAGLELTFQIFDSSGGSRAR